MKMYKTRQSVSQAVIKQNSALNKLDLSIRKYLRNNYLNHSVMYTYVIFL